MSIDRLPWLYDSESVRGWQFLKAILFIVLGVGALLWMLFHKEVSAKELMETGTRIEGRVYRMETLQNGRERIAYGFTVGSNVYNISERLAADCNGLSKLGPITVWYDPADPHRCTTEHEVRLEEAKPGRIWLVLFLVVMMVLAAFQIYAILQPPPGGTLIR